MTSSMSHLKHGFEEGFTHLCSRFSDQRFYALVLKQVYHACTEHGNKTIR